MKSSSCSPPGRHTIGPAVRSSLEPTARSLTTRVTVTCPAGDSFTASGVGPWTPAIRVPAGQDEPAVRLGRPAATRPAGRGGDPGDVRWELGRFGKLNVRHGKGARC